MTKWQRLNSASLRVALPARTYGRGTIDSGILHAQLVPADWTLDPESPTAGAILGSVVHVDAPTDGAWIADIPALALDGITTGYFVFWLGDISEPVFFRKVPVQFEDAAK